MDAAIVSIGSELATGELIDSNAAWLAAGLTRLGIRVAWHVTVGDDQEAIRRTLTQALDGCDVTLVSGGLGPTADDLTRFALADAIGRPLAENVTALDQIRGLFARWQRPMPDSNRVQAMIPEGCRVIPNTRGTAPGIRYESGARALFALPGVPDEMKAMFQAAVAPVLRSLAGTSSIHEARLACFGISEARLGELLADVMRRDRNPQVGTTASRAVIRVRVVGTGADETEVRRLVAADLAEIRRRVGDAVFGEGDDTLELAVARLLRDHSLTIATAESCTGGLLAKRLTDIPGSSLYFLRGYVTYSNGAKSDLLGVPPKLIAEHGAVSEPVARAMACGCRAASGADIALATTGIAGPDGGSPPEKPVGLVYVALASSSGVDVRRLLLGEHLSREGVRDRACSSILNLLRLHLMRGAPRRET
jgi:nicotinamide-nucleotide amidase